MYMMLAVSCGFFMNALYRVEEVALNGVLSVFIMKMNLVLSNTIFFFASIEMIIAFPLHLINVVNDTDWFLCCTTLVFLGYIPLGHGI